MSRLGGLSPAERVELALACQPLDRPPWTCYYPFGLQHMSGEAQASVHLAFAERYGVDLVRICCDYPYPLAKGQRLERSKDFAALEPLEGKQASFDHSLSCIKKVHAGLKGTRYLLDTVASPFTTLARLAGHELCLQAMREHPGFFKSALEAVTRTLERYAGRALEAGAQGLFLLISAASHQHMSPEEYSEHIAPYDERVLQAASEAPCNAIYAVGSRLFLEPLKALPCRLLGWSQVHAGPGLVRGRANFSGAILGGLDELHPEHYPDILARSAEEWTAPGLILAPGGPLPAETDPRRLDDLRQAVLALTQEKRDKPAPKPRRAREPRPEPTSYPTPRTTGRSRLTASPPLGAGDASSALTED